MDEAKVGMAKLFLLLLLFCTLSVQAQSKKQLEQERRLLLKEIKSTSKLLSSTSEDKKATLGQLVTLRKQIKSRTALVRTLKAEVDYSKSSINRTKNIVAALTEDVKNLRIDYKRIIRQQYRMKRSQSKFQILFSSVSINDLFVKWRVLRQYENYRKKQTQLIINTKGLMTNKLSLLNNKQVEHLELIKKEENQKATLANEVAKQKEWLEKLQSEEKRLKIELAQHKIEHEDLNVAIENIIRGDIAKRRANSLAVGKNSTAANKTAVDFTTMSRGFQRKNGKLPWPVAEGVVVRAFGEQAHPTLPDIKINNNGIDISTSPNEAVKTVHEGKVVGKQFLPGQNYLVLIKHGEYFTIYSHLKTVQVNRGDYVKLGDTIGVVHTNENTNSSIVHFEVWKNKTRLNPQRWLLRR